jgi:phosphatidylglycerophosphate synthase
MGLPKLKDIREIQHTKWKTEDFYLTHFYRKIDLPLTWLFIVLKIDTKLVTLLGVIGDLFAAYSVLQGNFILAGILVQLGLILDCCDGEVARWRNKTKKLKNPPRYGGYLDKVLGYVGFATTIFAIAIVNDLPWLGYAAVFGLLMIHIASVTGKMMFPQSKEDIKNLRKENSFMKYSRPFEFGMSVQRGIITLAAFNLYPVLMLWVFTAASQVYWLIRLYIYKNY